MACRLILLLTAPDITSTIKIHAHQRIYNTQASEHATFFEAGMLNPEIESDQQMNSAEKKSCLKYGLTVGLTIIRV